MPNQISVADYLKITNLPDKEPFELSPARPAGDGIWMIRVRVAGRADYHVHPARMGHYLNQVRDAPPDLTNQIAACLKQ